MSAFLGWIDYSERERRRMLDTLSLLKQQGILDELGIGTVRDALADLLFPGTSTIQTRPRYFLIIPWIYERVERTRWKGRTAATIARDIENRVTESLRRGPNTSGVIGVDAGPALIRPASDIYWQGLKRWGIRLFDGSRGRYHRWLDQQRSREILSSELATTDDGEATLVAPSRWHPSLPQPPASFPELEGLELQQEEANYLRERILITAPDSLLAAVLREKLVIEGASFPWTITANADLSEPVAAHVKLAKHFSESMHGAALIYNLMLARETRSDARIEEYETRLGSWSGLVQEQAGEFVGWDSTGLWVAVISAGRAASEYTRTFVEAWHRLVVSRLESGSSPAALADDPSVHRLIRTREWQIKHSRARLENASARASWSGESGATQLDYRWPVVQTHMRDLLRGSLADA